MFPNKILYGKTNRSDKGFGTILIDNFGAMNASFTAHDSEEKAKGDAENRQNLYRTLFSQTINIVNNVADVEMYLTK